MENEQRNVPVAFFSHRAELIMYHRPRMGCKLSDDSFVLRCIRDV